MRNLNIKETTEITKEETMGINGGYSFIHEIIHIILDKCIDPSEHNTGPCGPIR